MIGFGVLFWLFQKGSKKNARKYNVTLEEKAFVLAYEALRFLKEYFDKDHPILGSKRRAINRLGQISYLFGSTGLPSVYIIREQAIQLRELRINLRSRLVPSVRSVRLEDSKTIENIYSTMNNLLVYLSKPTLDNLKDFNTQMLPVTENLEKSFVLDFASTVFRRSNLRHVIVFSFSVVSSFIVYYSDITFFGAIDSSAFELSLMFLVGIVAIYVTYLGLSVRKELKS